MALSKKEKIKAKIIVSNKLKKARFQQETLQELVATQAKTLKGTVKERYDILYKEVKADAKNAKKSVSKDLLTRRTCRQLLKEIRTGELELDDTTAIDMLEIPEKKIIKSKSRKATKKIKGDK